MRKHIEKGSEEYQLFMDFWNFRQEYHDGEDSEQFWADMVNAGTLIAKKYENTPIWHFAQELILSCVEETEISWKKGKGIWEEKNEQLLKRCSK